ncbi:unnamed protein product [Anisakis simplex]|uniref:LRAT domain-containing protein n=1 Tax=Anisakis simplex TaxID=6269 RepID=A0A0M3JT03_ANISI|nr:unnamed protein product [Anisakis simplex]
MDPECRLRILQNRQTSSSQSSSLLSLFNRSISPSNTRETFHSSGLSKCQYQDIYLIPGHADASCTRPGAKRLVEIDPRQVNVKPEVLKIPGCFTIEIKNVRILDHGSKNDADSFFAKVEYQWWNVKDFSELKCQNASNNGCGGYGNNCYYCDICESLTDLGVSEAHSTLSDQLRGIKCPTHPGFYTFRKEFCFNDWSAFDTDGDCQFDFFQGDKLSDYRSALASLQQVGYGTVVAKLRLAYNASGVIEEKKVIKEKQIEENVIRELEERRDTWEHVNNVNREIIFRDDYLPWLLYENEISCLRLTFDVCERSPRRYGYGLHYQCA